MFKKSFSLYEKSPAWVWNLYCGISVFIENIGRLLVYIPVIWKHRDFDYAYTLDLWRFSISRLRKTIENGHNINSKLIIRKMKIVEELLDRVSNGVFLEKAHDEYNKKWNNDELPKTAIFNKTMTPNQRRHFKRITDKEIKLDDYNRKYLFKLIEKHIKTWWD